MSHDHPDAIESNIETHPIKLAVIIGVGSVAMVVGIIMLAYFAVGMYGGTVTAAEREALKPDATSKRIAPVGRVEVDESKKPAPTAAATTPAAVPVMAAAVIPAANIPPPAAAAAADGKAIYAQACTACHTMGIAGAPKTGDKVAWADRAKQGSAKLYEHAIKGFTGKAGVMPAKGGNATLSDDAVKAAVDYMLAQSK
jgi:cytochrome c5